MKHVTSRAQWLLVPMGGMIAAGALAVSGSLTSAQSPTPGATGTPGSDQLTQTPSASPSSGTTQAQADLPTYDEALAEELGISVEELRGARSTAWDNYFDELANADVISQEEAGQLKDWSPNEIIEQAIDNANVAQIRDVLLAEVAKIFDMDREDLEQDLSEGKSLDEIAEEQGTSLEEIGAELQTEAESILDMGVQAGFLTEEQRTKISDGLDSILESIIEMNSDGTSDSAAGGTETPPAGTPTVTTP